MWTQQTNDNRPYQVLTMCQASLYMLGITHIKEQNRILAFLELDTLVERARETSKIYTTLDSDSAMKENKAWQGSERVLCNFKKEDQEELYGEGGIQLKV